jgi:hypothetical protein
MKYQFQKERVRASVALLAADPERYRLDEELAIMRLTLQDTINAITTESDREYALMQASDTIRNLVATIEKTSQTCLQQSVNLGLLLTKEDLMEHIQKIVDVLAEEIEDEETLLRIANRIDRVLSGSRDSGSSNNQSLQLDGPVSTD